MPRHLILGMFAVLSLSPGCQKFKDRFDAVATQCGVDPASIQADEIFVKLESPLGEELSAETLLTTQSRVLRPTRNTENLTITARGCVRLQKASGVLQAFSTVQGWSLSQPLDQIKSQGLLRLPLQPSPQVSAELQCPTQGFYAHRELPFPLRWTSNGTLNSTRFEVTAYDKIQDRSFLLFEKPYGLHVTDLPQNIRTEDLPEGQYELRLSFQISTDKWDEPGRIPTRTESCPLTILHRRPEVGGLDGYALDNHVAVFAKGDVLPWKTTSEQSDLLFCREKRGEDLDESSYPDAADACRPLAQCQDIKNFQRAGAIVADELGVFDYYAYAEDRSGQRSGLSCQTLVITEKKPELQLLWSEADWNKPSAQMRVPRANVQLRILAKHPQLEDATLSSRYQCKADFVREDQSTLTGRPVICISGRCRNQSLEKFVPCDPDLNLSIVDLWPNMKPEGGVLRVFVRADDRAGHIEEQMATIGIQPQRWKPTRWSASTNIEDSTRQMLQDRQGRIFTLTGQYIYQRDEAQERWIDLPGPPGAEDGYMSKIWFSQEGELHAELEVVAGEVYNYLIFRRTDAGWQQLPPLHPKNVLQCHRPQPWNKGGFWCSTDESLAVFEGGAWNVMPIPAEGADDCKPVLQAYYLLQDQAKTLWLGCNSVLFQKPEGQNAWTRMDDARPLVKLAIDAKERVWTLRGTSRDDLTLSVTEGGTTRTLPKPASFTSIDLRAQDFVVGPASEIILGDAYWDESQGSWQVFPYFLQKHPGQRVSPHFLNRGELIWFTEQGLLQWDGERLRDWDLGVHGLSPGYMEVAMGTDGAPWMLASQGGYSFPYQFHLKNWMYFPRPNLNPSSTIAGLWVDEQSTARIYIPNDGLYTLEPGGWTRSIRSPGVREAPLETDVFEPIVLNTQGFFQWTPEKDWIPVIRFPEPSQYWGGTRDAKGRFWVYRDDSMELGVLDGANFFRVPLGPDAGTNINGLFARNSEIVVATDRGFLSRTEGQDTWNLIPWQDFGLQTVDRVRQIDADTYFVSVTDETGMNKEFWLLDLNSKTKKSFAVPAESYFLRDVRKTSKGDYIMSIRFDVFRTDGITYTKILSQREIYSVPQVPGVYLNIWRLQLDANDRIWFDTGYGVFRIDLY